MPTVLEILTAAPGACYLAANANDNKSIFQGGRINPLLPSQIYAGYFVAKKIYDLDPTYDGLVPVCNYLWELMGRYGVQAQGLSGGGSVTPINPTMGYEYYELSLTWDCVPSYIYQNNAMIGALAIGYIFVNGIAETVQGGQLTINYTTGTITRVNPFYSGDIIVIPMWKLTSATAGVSTLSTPTLTATVLSGTAIDLSWIAIPNASNYLLQRATDSGFTANLTDLLNGAALLYHDTGLTAGTTYYYRLEAYADGYHCSDYGTANATTGSWTPANLPDLWAWFDASQGVTGTTAVSLWADQSGLGHDLVQATANRQPRLTTGVINSLPVIELNAILNSQARMVTAATFPGSSVGSTIYMVAAQAITGLHTDSSGVYCEYALNSSLNRDASTNDVQSIINGDAIINSTIVDGTFYTLGVITDGVTESFRINAAAIGSAISAVPASDQAFYIFQNHLNANTGNKQFAEIIVCDAEITNGDRTLLETYLQTKYAHY